MHIASVLFAVGSVQSAGTGEFPVDSSQRRRDLFAGDQGNVSRAQDSDAAKTHTAPTRSHWARRQAQTGCCVISASCLTTFSGVLLFFRVT